MKNIDFKDKKFNIKIKKQKNFVFKYKNEKMLILSMKNKKRRFTLLLDLKPL